MANALSAVITAANFVPPTFAVLAAFIFVISVLVRAVIDVLPRALV